MLISRSERARSIVGELVREHGVGVQGADSLPAVARADVVVLCVPWAAHREYLDALSEVARGKQVLDVASPSTRRTHPLQAADRRIGRGPCPGTARPTPGA